MKKWICCLGLILCAGTVDAKPVSVLELQAGVEQWIESHSGLAGTNETYDALTTLGISNVAVSVLVDDGKIAVFSKVDTDLSDARATWLSQTNLIQLESV